MAQANLNPLISALRGDVSGLVFKQYGGKIVVTRKPDMSRVAWSEAQQQGRQRFRQAAQVARQAMDDPALKARYAAAGKAHGRPAYRVALGDALNPPVVDSLDLAAYHGHAGDPIVVWAHDDFEVVRVEVTVARQDGTPVEAGEATPDAGGGRWVYRASISLDEGEAVRVTVMACDRAGNQSNLCLLAV